MKLYCAALSRCGRRAYKSLLAKIFLGSIDSDDLGNRHKAEPATMGFELLVFGLFGVANYFLRECRELNDNKNGERRACRHCVPRW